MHYKIRTHLENFVPVSYSSVPECIANIPKEELIDCSYGTNPFGYSQNIASYLDDLQSDDFFALINGYPDTTYTSIKEKISQYFASASEISPSSIRLGTGSVGLLEKVTKLIIDSDSHVLGFVPQFTEFSTCVESFGGVYDYVTLRPENNYAFSANDLITAMKPEHRLVYIDNPSNPTGQLIPLSAIAQVCQAAKDLGLLVLVDEAYGDFVDLDCSAAALFHTYDNLLVTRSFSKGLGIAGLRVGYLFGHDDFLQEYDKIDLPFSVTALAVKVCEQALEDKDFIVHAREEIKANKTAFINQMTKTSVWTTTNDVPIFTWMHPNPDVNFFELLAEHKVFTEPASGFHEMPQNTVRLRIPKDITPLLSILKEIEKEL
ncbi:histidinol-phosphate transaminase [Chakrabartyella piscis]|uniref:pyridoxal phosphate-dependent aminotransferase n=1 Tax=Chakrabartyella piscis TaxID=2918914 RepID=UPI002958A1FE|nr:histidinol-phosphate transaminase [Chakrabartyella piscis]